MLQNGSKFDLLYLLNTNDKMRQIRSILIITTHNLNIEDNDNYADVRTSFDKLVSCLKIREKNDNMNITKENDQRIL